jgi:hypothetical protein
LLSFSAKEPQAVVVGTRMGDLQLLNLHIGELDPNAIADYFDVTRHFFAQRHR